MMDDGKVCRVGEKGGESKNGSRFVCILASVVG